VHADHAAWIVRREPSPGAPKGPRVRRMFSPISTIPTSMCWWTRRLPYPTRLARWENESTSLVAEAALDMGASHGPGSNRDGAAYRLGHRRRQPVFAESLFWSLISVFGDSFYRHAVWLIPVFTRRLS